MLAEVIIFYTYFILLEILMQICMTCIIIRGKIKAEKDLEDSKKSPDKKIDDSPIRGAPPIKLSKSAPLSYETEKKKLQDIFEKSIEVD